MKAKLNNSAIGGAAFFLSYPCLIYLVLSNLLAFPDLLDWFAFKNLIQFGFAVLIGLIATGFFVREHYSVFVHELKHSMLANLAGNKHKGMKIDRSSGHYEYSYTKATEKYNALISLAPYFFPLGIILAVFATALFYLSFKKVTVIFLGLGAGFDLYSNIRDISPIQTDLTQIRGGYKFALVFIALINILIFELLLAWVMQQWLGLHKLFLVHWDFFSTIYLFFLDTV